MPPGRFRPATTGLPRAAIGAGLHYVDLADARAFVSGSRVLDEEARAANVAVLAGASSTPALSHAVLDTLVAGSRKVIAIEVSIAPGNRAPRGPSTVHAVLSTVGQPIRVFRGCRWIEEVGWGLNKTIELPGVGKRRVALCETPDLDLLVERYHPAADAIFRAGLELRVLHEGVAALGLLVRLGILKSLAALARPLRALAELFKPFGTDRGGMRVDVLLENDAGQLLRRVWTLAADGGDGLYVPTLPALAALKMLAAGTLEWRGAGPCAGLIPYDAIAAEFGHHNIKTQTQEISAPAPLFRRLLGDAYDALPPVDPAGARGARRSRPRRQSGRRKSRSCPRHVDRMAVPAAAIRFEHAGSCRDAQRGRRIGNLDANLSGRDDALQPAQRRFCDASG